jgi:ribosomal protein S18 acetylase RimI-like enzyme
MLSITVRETGETDLEQVGAWYLQFYEEKGDPGLGLALFDTKPERTHELDWFEGFLASCVKGDAVGLVAEVEGELAGFCEVNRNRPGSTQSHRGGLTVSVKKRFRGMGVGTALLEEMIRRCRGRFESLELEVFVGNEAAKHLYQRHGFKTYGLRPQSVKRNGGYVDEELMYLRL